MARVLYLCSGRSFRAATPGRKIGDVVQCWRRAGHNVRHVCGGDLLAGASGSLVYGSQETYTRWYRRVPGMKPLARSISEWRDIQHDREVLAHLETISGEWRPDVVWERSSRLHSAGLVYARQLGVPYVLEWKDHLVDYRVSLFRTRALRTESCKNREADRIVVESAVLRDALGHDGVDTSKIIVAHNAVQANQFSRDLQKRVRVREHLGIDEDTVLVGYLGSYAFYHDTARLVLAADIIRKQETSRKVHILMVGAGEEYPRSRALAEKLGLLHDVITMEPGVPKDEVPGILSALDIAVLPGSTDIICPIKVQEYMASQLPSLVPAYSCNREVITDGQTGALFRPGDEVDLADGIIALAEDEQLREKMGQRARQAIVTHFSWEATWGAALETVLRRVSS